MFDCCWDEGVCAFRGFQVVLFAPRYPSETPTKTPFPTDTPTQTKNNLSTQAVEHDNTQWLGHAQPLQICVRYRFLGWRSCVWLTPGLNRKSFLVEASGHITTQMRHLHTPPWTPKHINMHRKSQNKSQSSHIRHTAPIFNPHKWTKKRRFLSGKV